MEAAAVAAYRKDVQSNANADLTSMAIHQRLQEENLEIKDSSKMIWYEAKSKEGHTYYWNIITNGMYYHCLFFTLSQSPTIFLMIFPVFIL